ncbi:hypothetical protein ACFLYR_05810 [Chloroflexota bacterium]
MAKSDIRCRQQRRGFRRTCKTEAGYALAWVLILTMVSSLVTIPFLQFMLAGLRVSHSYADTMGEYYAADSGIEDAIHKIQYDYTATGHLTGDIDSDDAAIPVDSAVLLPQNGIIQIEAELISYSGKSGTELTGCTRGYGGTTASNHGDGTLVTANLPEDAGDSWQYGIEDINGRQIDVAIERLWLLDGLESDANGTTPHSELVVIGQVLDIPATELTDSIDDDDTTIPVLSCGSFPTATDIDPSIIRLEDELIQYTGKTGTDFTGCTRGVNSTSPADHAPNTAVTSEEVTYRVDIAYDNSVGNLKIDKVGAWLPTGFGYVTGSSNVASTLRLGVFNTATVIPVESTNLFPDADEDNPQFIAIEHELIQYTGKTSDTITGCTRGYDGTIATDHLTVGTPVSVEPQQSGHLGGTALYWTFNNIDFETLPSAIPSGGEGGFTPGVEFPTKRTVTFSLSPAAEPKGIFSWIRTNRTDINLSWDNSSGIYKITSNATDPSTGTHTTLESYVGRCKLSGRVSQIYGDARAIGNSLMKDLYGNSRIRETLLSQSSATVSDIPEDASVEAAYLYWSGWKLSPAYDEDNLQPIAELIDEATLNGAAIRADRIQILENRYGWGYSCFKDVTSHLDPEQSVTITFNPTVATQITTITNTGSETPSVTITADGGNPGNMIIDGIIIAPGAAVSFNVKSAVVMSSGSAVGDYAANIEINEWLDSRSVDVEEPDGTTTDLGRLYNQSDVNITLTSTASLPEATITKSTTSAYVDIIASSGNPGDIQVLDSSVIIEPGETEEDLWYNNTNPSDTLRGATFEPYEITVTCTDGIVTIDYDSGSVVLGEPGSRMANGTYTVGDVEADAGIEDGGSAYEWAYAGWSLIIMYSSPSEEAHQLYLYDNFLYADSNTTHTFTVTGFLAPSDSEGVLTCFVGEGDDHYDGDYIKFNDNFLSDATNPEDNVWNGKSSGLAGQPIDGVDIDTFDVASYIDEEDTSAVVQLGTSNEIWSLVYLLLSFRTDIVPDSGRTPVGIITYGPGG